MNNQTLVSRKPRIRIFNPHRLKADELQESFIARQELFRAILDDLSTGKPKGSPQHHLVVGQRGMGKTTLLRRLALELHSEPYCQQLLPLNFPEEQYIEVDRMSKFWLNCLDAMADSLEHEGLGDVVQRIDDEVQRLTQVRTDETSYQEACREAFTGIWKEIGRRPVLFIDNFNLLLSRLRNDDYSLRGYFSTRGAPILVTASTVYPDEMADYGAAFYDGFKPHYLHPLTLDEVRDVLVHLAKMVDKPELVNRVYQEQPRLAALRDLTGGNPRTAALLFELFADGFSEDAFEDLDALLDMTTPLYQSRLDQLPELAQTIVGTLARNWSPMTKADIVREARLVDSSVPPQLGRLREIGLVEETPLFPSKKTGYQIAERFFNIWYLMRFASRRQRAGLASLTRFLEEFHTPAERSRSAHELLARDGMTRGNITYAMALAGSLSDEPAMARELEWKAQLELIQQMEGVRTRIAEILDPDEIPHDIYSFAELKQRLERVVPADSPVTGREFAELVLGSPSLVPDGAGGQKANNRHSIAAATLTSGDETRLVGELRQEHIRLSQRFSPESLSWLKTRLNAGTLTSWHDAEALSSLILLADDQASMRLAREFGHPAAKRNLSNTAFEKLCKILELRPGSDASATNWHNHGYDLHEEFGRYVEAEAAYREAIRIDPNYAWPWNGLGNLLLDHLSRYAEAEAAYREAIRIDPNLAYPWDGLGNLLQDHLSRYAEAEAAYREAIRIDPNLAYPWNGLGNLLLDHFRRHDEAASAYHRALEADPDEDSPRHNLVYLLRDFRRQPAEAMKVLQDLHDMSKGRDTQELHIALFSAYDSDWPKTAESLTSALALIGGRLPADTRDDWFRASAVLLHLGYGEQLVELLRKSGADVTMLPWFAAVRAHTIGDKRHLRNLPVEARPAAEQIFDQIQTRRNQLPKP